MSRPGPEAFQTFQAVAPKETPSRSVLLVARPNAVEVPLAKRL